MRLLLRIIVLSMVIFCFIIFAWNIFFESENKPIQKKPIFFKRYAIDLLNQINYEIKSNSDNSNELFMQSILSLLEISPKLCDLELLYTVPKCELTKRKLITNMTFKQISIYAEQTFIQYGGYWIQKDCKSDQIIAIIIPFRDRWRQVMHLLPILHQILQIQNNCYRIFLVEQLGSEAFNKGRLNNAGFLESISMFYFNCVIFHDTDLIPETFSIPYACNDNHPIHLASAVDTNNYHLPYSTILGGVIAFKPFHYISINGYSNYYWGWGLEDDDMELRLKDTLGYTRIPESIGRYQTIKHQPQRKFPIQELRRDVLLSTAKRRMKADGLNNLKYHVIRKTNKRLFTHIIVDIGYQPIEFF